MPIKTYRKDVITPIRLLMIVAITIFIAEAIIMLILPIFGELTIIQIAMLDASLLLFVMFPILYFFLLKPLRAHLSAYNNLEQMIFEIEKREQKNIGRDLHDSLGQLLTGIAFKTRAVEKKLKQNTRITPKEIGDITGLIDRSKKEAKQLSKRLLSPGAEGESLVMALAELAKDTERIYGISCTFTSKKPVRILNKRAMTHLFRIAQEAVTNAVKHGKPTMIDITLTKKNDKIELTIRDDGKGMSVTSRQTQGFGLQIMNHRANSMGAFLDIYSELNRGTIILCQLTDTMERQ